jgi:hypothetical protein
VSTNAPSSNAVYTPSDAVIQEAITSGARMVADAIRTSVRRTLLIGLVLASLWFVIGQPDP